MPNPGRVRLHLQLHTSTLAWTASVVWDWCYVFDLLYGHPCCLQSGNCTFTTGARSFDSDFNFLHSALGSFFGCLLSGYLPSERRAFARTLESAGSSTCPAKGITLCVSNGHSSVVKGRLDMGYRYGDVSSGFSSLVDLCRHYSVSQILVETSVTLIAALGSARLCIPRIDEELNC